MSVFSQNGNYIREGDPNYDHYLLKITSQQPELSDNTQQDDNGTAIPCGCKVLQGHFFVIENLLDMTYRLDDKTAALVHVRTIWFVCFDLKVLKKKGKNEKKHIQS